jgi:hypothetical protein
VNRFELAVDDRVAGTNLAIIFGPSEGLFTTTSWKPIKVGVVLFSGLFCVRIATFTLSEHQNSLVL